MPATRSIDVQFPLGGEHKAFAYQRQAPYTTRRASNTRPVGTLESSMRGGSRPALVKSFAQQIGGTSAPIRLLTVMRSLNAEGRGVFFDDLDAANNWDAASWSDGLPTFNGNAEGTPDSILGAALKSGSVPSMNNAADIHLESVIVQNNHSDPDLFWYFQFYGLIDNATPLDSEGVSVRIQFTGNVASGYKVQITFYRLGVATVTSGLLPITFANGTGVFGWTIEPNGIMRAFWDDMSLPIFAEAGSITASGDNFGFTLWSEADASAARIQDLRIGYVSTTAGVPPEAKIASANGELWRESTEGTMVEIANYNSLNLGSDRPIQAVDRLGKLYIADTSDTRIADTDGDGVITNGRLDDANVADWTAHGILQGNDVVELTAITGGAGAFSGVTAAVYAVSLTGGAIHATNGVLLQELNGSDLGAGANCTTCKYRIVRGAKVYDSNTDALTHYKATAGLVPVGCPIIELLFERIVLGGTPELPHVVYMSRGGDPNDFDVGASATDRTKAWSNAGASSDTSSLSLPLSSIVALTEDYCIFSAESEMYLLRGDPNLGGIMGNISRQIGIGSRTAHCRVPDGSLVFLSRDGLYKFHPSQLLPPSMSREKLPTELIDVVQNTSLVVTLEYDVRYRGVHIYVTPTTAGATKHYWFHWETQSFWTVVLGDRDYEPFALTYDAKANRVLLGCRDGYIRHYDSAASSDDGTAISSEVFIGPLRLGTDGFKEGQIIDIDVILDRQSGDAQLDVHVGESAEAAFASKAFSSHTLTAGRNVLDPMARGVACYLKLADDSGSQWVFEGLRVRMEALGDWRPD